MDEPQGFDPRPWLERQRWRRAQTGDHEYALALRGDPEFRAVADYIATHGYKDTYNGTTYRYWEIDGWLVWRSWRPPAINRRRPEW